MASTTHEHLREHWRDLKQGRPGRRFQERYERARREERKVGAWQRIALFVGAGVCLVIGAVLTVFPGPAILFFFLAGGLLATESRTIARVMDWIELRIRALIAGGKRVWRRLPTAGRIAVVTVVVAGAAAGGYVSLRLLRG